LSIILEQKITISLPYNYTPREYQIPVLAALDKGIKRIVLCWHRRSGKDYTILNWCVKQLYMEPIVCFYVMPSYAQAKKVIWDSVDNDGKRMIDCIPKEIIAQKNAQEMKVRFTNGSLLQLIGSDNIDSLMGTNPKVVVFSEYALQSPDAWEYIRPILKVNGGTAIFISTPRGRNHFYDLFRTGQSFEGWFTQKLTIEDTNVLTKNDVDQEMLEGMSEELALQEYYCSFDRGIEGSFYAKLMQKLHEEERICEINYDPYKLVHTAWDLGWDDETVIIFFQLVGDNIKIIDYEHHSTKTLAWYRDLLRSKPYKYGTHLFPHDVEQIDGISTGCTRREILEELEISVTTVQKLLISDGIEAVKSILSSKVYINTNKCKDLIKSLEHYHREWDDKKKIYKNAPLHDWSSHGADSMRYLAVGLSKIKGPSRPLDDDDFKAVRAFWGG